MTEVLNSILERPEDEGAWRRFAELSPAQRREVLHGLKAQIDGLISSRPRDALPIAQSLVRAADAVPDLQGSAVEALGAVFFQIGELQGAAEEYERAVDLHLLFEKELEGARVKRALVLVYQQLGRFEEAFEHEREARATLERLEEHELLAQLDVHLGNLYVRRDEYPKARECYAHARSIFEDRGNELAQAVVDFNVGVVEQNANRLDEAERAFESARRCFEAHDQRAQVARCEYSRAYLESRRGRFGAAIEGLERAAKTFDEQGQASWQALCDLDLAEIYLRLDARRDALEYALRGEQRFGELGMQYERARCESFQGMAHARLGELDAARGELTRAGHRFRELGNEVYAAAMEIQTCGLEAERQPSEAVITRLEAARSQLEKRNLRLLADLATITLARALVSRGDARRAIAELEETTDPGRGRGVPDILVSAEALHALAAARCAAGDVTGAIADLRRAIRATEETYIQVPGSDIRMAFFRDRHEAYADLAELLSEGTEPGAVREALAVLEQSRLRSLREDGALQGQEDEEFRNLRDHLNWLLSRRLDADLGLSPPDHQENGHQLRLMPPSDSEIMDAERELVNLGRRLEAQPPAPRAAQPGSAELDIDAARRGDEVLIAYLQTRKGLRAFAVDDSGISCTKLPVEEGHLARLRDRLFLHMDKLRLGSAYIERHLEQLLSSVNSVLDELGEHLLAPLLEGYGGRPLVVIPYGDLHDLPFHAFRLGGRPVVADHEVSYGLSGAMVARCRGRATGRVGGALVTGTSGARLTETESEVEFLRTVYGERCELIAPEDLPQRLRDDPPRGGLVHIASHGQYEPQNPAFSSLCLGQTFLLAHDIRRLELDVDLVTLSGCETGRKRRIGGEELLGLPRALVAAGARAVLGSLWAVDDGDAQRFMRRFYENLAEGRTARQALARAQRQLLPEPSHPFSWAPFILLGDPDVRIPAPGVVAIT